MHLDPLLLSLVAFTLVVIVACAVSRRLKQPYVVAYLVAGVALGPQGFGVFENPATIEHLGAIGVVLLLFFVGMEISLPKLLGNWRIAIVGTLFQILASVGVVAVIGHYWGWNVQRVVLVGCVISMSSSSVLFKVLQDWKELDSPIGQNVVSISLVQDLAIVPMLIVVGLLGGQAVEPVVIGKQVVGGVAFGLVLVYVLKCAPINLPFGASVRNDHELQVFVAMALCFGLALLTGLAELSTALGAFLGGVVVGSTRETTWIRDSLGSFRIVFLALFFASVGMLIDFRFLLDHILLMGALQVAVLLTNAVINAFVLKLLGETWRESLYSGVLLSPIGEFSFVLAAVGVQQDIISDFGYKTAIGTISLSLLVSPVCIHLARRFILRPQAVTA